MSGDALLLGGEAHPSDASISSSSWRTHSVLQHGLRLAARATDHSSRGSRVVLGGRHLDPGCRFATILTAAAAATACVTPAGGHRLRHRRGPRRRRQRCCRHRRRRRPPRADLARRGVRCGADVRRDERRIGSPTVAHSTVGGAPAN